jgi:hypothetical protein
MIDPIWNDLSGIEHHGVKHLSDVGVSPMTALGRKPKSDLTACAFRFPLETRHRRDVRSGSKANV